MTLSWIARGAASAERGRRLMELRGVTPNGHPLWNLIEVGDLVETRPSYPAFVALHPRRTTPASRSKASRIGVAGPQAKQWDTNEVLRLRRVYPSGTRDEIIAAFPGRSYSAIARAANARGIYRKKGPEPPTGIRILDQILLRAGAKGYSLADLDRFSRSKSYFRCRRWRKTPDNAAHCRAARALGGTLRASFS